MLFNNSFSRVDTDSYTESREDVTISDVCYLIIRSVGLTQTATEGQGKMLPLVTFVI